MTGALATWQLSFSLQIALAAIPVALYFLILGLLNSQHRPQLLTERTDFTLLLAAISPLCAMPLVSLLGASLVTFVLVAAIIAGGIGMLAPRPQRGWVIYNINVEEALHAVEQAAAASGVSVVCQGRTLRFADGTAIRLSAFPLLRNVSLSLAPEGAPPDWLHRFEAALAAQIARVEVIASPMAVSLVLIATAMIVAPLVLLADRVPEMARLLTDLLGQ